MALPMTTLDLPAAKMARETQETRKKELTIIKSRKMRIYLAVFHLFFEGFFLCRMKTLEILGDKCDYKET